LKRNAAFEAKFSCRLIVGIAARTAHFPSPQATAAPIPITIAKRMLSALEEGEEVK
jgi:hypothetical protein